jgi:hypothetical protein
LRLEIGDLCSEGTHPDENTDSSLKNTNPKRVKEKK